MTERLYYHAPYQTEFDTKVTDIIEKDGKVALILERSCFYPTSGGQSFDMGTLTLPGSGITLEVCDVVVDNKVKSEPSVLHFIDPTEVPLQMGMEIHGTIDWQRRYDHMQQHSSQHLLSHALGTLLGWETISVHFGATESTIDVQQSEQAQSSGSTKRLGADQLMQVENYVNDVVYENVSISAYFVDQEKLSTLPLRRPPKVQTSIRIVEIAELDYSACGGTHCRHSGELGPIKLVKQESVRGNLRLTFLSGHRAMRDYTQKHRITTEVATLFSNELSRVPSLVQGLIDQNKVLEKQAAGLKQQILVAQADALWEKAEPFGPFRLIVEELTDVDPNGGKILASMLQAHDDAIILLAISSEEKLTAIFARGSSPKFLEGNLHMGDLLRSTLSEFGGGGGGKEDFAQGGGVPATTATAVLTAAVAQIQSSATSM